MKLHEWKRKDEEVWVKPQACMVCKTVVAGAYGMWADGWTCSKSCESLYKKGGNNVHIKHEERVQVRVGVASVPLVLPHD